MSKKIIKDALGNELRKATKEEIAEAKKKIEEMKAPLCPVCEKPYTAYAYNAGEGWWLYWDCKDEEHIGTAPTDMDWPFPEDIWVDTEMLASLGFEII